MSPDFGTLGFDRYASVTNTSNIPGMTTKWPVTSWIVEIWLSLSLRSSNPPFATSNKDDNDDNDDDKNNNYDNDNDNDNDKNDNNNNDNDDDDNDDDNDNDSDT